MPSADIAKNVPLLCVWYVQFGWGVFKAITIECDILLLVFTLQVYIDSSLAVGHLKDFTHKRCRISNMRLVAFFQVDVHILQPCTLTFPQYICSSGCFVPNRITYWEFCLGRKLQQQGTYMDFSHFLSLPQRETGIQTTSFETRWTHRAGQIFKTDI